MSIAKNHDSVMNTFDWSVTCVYDAKKKVVKEFNIYELEEYTEVSEAVMKLMYKLVECGMIKGDKE